MCCGFFASKQKCFTSTENFLIHTRKHKTTTFPCNLGKLMYLNDRKRKRFQIFKLQMTKYHFVLYSHQKAKSPLLCPRFSILSSFAFLLISGVNFISPQKVWFNIILSSTIYEPAKLICSRPSATWILSIINEATQILIQVLKNQELVQWNS